MQIFAFELAARMWGAEKNIEFFNLNFAFVGLFNLEQIFSGG